MPFPSYLPMYSQVTRITVCSTQHPNLVAKFDRFSAIEYLVAVTVETWNHRSINARLFVKHSRPNDGFIDCPVKW